MRLKLKGFTLIEMLVVLAILSVLAAAFFVNGTTLRARGREALAMSHGGVVAQAVQGYFALWITDTPSAFMARLAGQLAGADWTGVPSGARSGSSASDRSCATAFTIPDPTGAATSFSWPGAPQGVGCVLGLRTVGGVDRIRVVTWVRGSNRYYFDGQVQ